MRKRLRRILVLLLLLCTASSGHAQLVHAGDVFDGLDFFNGKEFYAWCRSPDPRDQRACEAYVCGVLDAWSMQYAKLHMRPYPLCLPTGITCKRLSELVTEYLTKDPMALGGDGSSAVGYPLLQMFRCLSS